MKMKRLLICGLPMLVVVMTACKGNVKAPDSPVSESTKVFTGATVIDVTGGTPSTNGVIVIEGTRIKQVGETAEIPPDAEVIDASGKFIIPGLADMHHHLAEGKFGFDEREPAYQENLRRLLAWGITLTYSTGIPDLEAFGNLKLISSDPAAPYPHFYAVGKQFGAESWNEKLESNRRRNGQGSIGGFSPGTPEEGRAGVRENAAANVDGIKFVFSPVTYAIQGGLPQMKPEIMEAIIDEAHLQGLKAMVHAPILKYAKDALRAGADGLVHGILDEPVDDEFIALMKQNDAFYMTTHAVFAAAGDIEGWARRLEEFDQSGMVSKEEIRKGMDPVLVSQWEKRWNNFSYMKNKMATLSANTKKTYDSGLLVVAGSDTGDNGAGLISGLTQQVELQLLVESGLTPLQALQTATINAARMIGRENDLGSLESGKLADFVILNADPLEDIQNINDIDLVVKGGVVHEPSQIIAAEVPVP